ncbi:MAG TPA: ABC transporter substrate binding protein [Burkholderiaceae bacterium]|nr:ABC transporter substrate binding protein [Burkholderiaceae bacterium]
MTPRTFLWPAALLAVAIAFCPARAERPSVSLAQVGRVESSPPPRAGDPAHGAVSAASLAVVYPNIGEPYRAVFARIIEGIEDRLQARVASFAVDANADMRELAEDLRRRHTRAVIALGRHGLRAATALDGNVRIVIGGVLSVPDAAALDHAVHSLAPDPELLFSRLRALMPSIRRVVVVYDPRQNAWLIRVARQAAKAHGLELITEEASDLAGAVRFYRQFLGTADPKRDGLWLIQDSTTLDDSTVLPLILQGAWTRSLVVISSNVSHVKRGALMALYPDNLALGRSLAESALDSLAAGARAGGEIRPLRQVLAAVNLRTAAHLGIEVRGQRFDLMFPEP